MNGMNILKNKKHHNRLAVKTQDEYVTKKLVNLQGKGVGYGRG